MGSVIETERQGTDSYPNARGQGIGKRINALLEVTGIRRDMEKALEEWSTMNPIRRRARVPGHIGCPLLPFPVDADHGTNTDVEDLVLLAAAYQALFPEGRPIKPACWSLKCKEHFEPEDLLGAKELFGAGDLHEANWFRLVNKVHQFDEEELGYVDVLLNKAEAKYPVVVTAGRAILDKHKAVVDAKCATDVEQLSNGKASADTVARGYAFYRHGSCWDIVIGNDRAIGVKHTYGMTYLQCLLERPHKPITAWDLQRKIQGRQVGATDYATKENSDNRIADEPADTDDGGSDDPRTTNLSLHGYKKDSGEMMDKTAKAQALKEIRRLETVRDSAKEICERTKAASQMAAIQKELDKSVTIRGQDRMIDKESEANRQAVCHALKRAIKQIGDKNSTVALYFERYVKTGNECKYKPDTQANWVFSDPTVTPPVTT